jgi:hypothetical protein
MLHLEQQLAVPPIALNWADEVHPFKYLIHKSSFGTNLLQILEGDKTAWEIENHACGEPWNWKNFLPNGLYILTGIHRIQDSLATDWNREWVDVNEIRQLTGPELLKFKKGELLC